MVDNDVQQKDPQMDKQTDGTKETDRQTDRVQRPHALAVCLVGESTAHDDVQGTGADQVIDLHALLARRRPLYVFLQVRKPY